jgi:hypothetical protein
MRRSVLALAAAFVATMRTQGAAAQTIAQHVDAVRDGVVLMSFAARPGVCGNGAGSIWTRGSWNSSGFSDQRNVCVAGPVRVALGRADNATVSVRVYVGGAWQASASEIDLGIVRPADAAEYLITVARIVGGRSGSDAVSAAALADYANVAPALVTLVRDANASLDTRRQALYWAGQADLSTRELARLYDDLSTFSLREHFTFVISQRRDDVAVDKLIDLARRDPDIEIRKRAMYWLGQTGDSRAVKFLRDLITR